MKIFVLGIPHTVTSTDFTTCAFTMKVFHLCHMMTRAGHTVYHLGVEGSTPDCTRHFSIVSRADFDAEYGGPGTGFYDTDETKHAKYMKRWAKNARLTILQNCDDDFEAVVCMTWGGIQRTAMEGVRQFEIESGIGYRHSWAPFRVYESYAWLHMHLGAEGLFNDPRFYWQVIPNSFDVSMFTPTEKRGEHFLYMGRLIDSKGIRIAVDAARLAGRKITLVGQGDPYKYLAPHVSYLPPVGVEARRVLMANARAVFCPSQYVEPFCGVSIEASLSGTPVITTDFGAFPENVVHGVTGFRCRTMDDFVCAAKNIDQIDGRVCREWGVANFSLERVAPMYTAFFEDVMKTKPGLPGWSGVVGNRTSLDTLRREYPYAI